MRRLVSIGLPSGGENLSYQLSQMSCLVFVNMMGTYVVTTRMYAVMFANCIFMLISAVSQAGQVLIGYLVGARDLDGAYACGMRILRGFCPVNVGISLLMYLAAGPLFGLFTKDARVIALGKTVMLIEVFLEIGRAFNIVLVRALQAAGDVRFPVAVGIASQWAVAVGLGYVLGVRLGMGLAGMWLAFAVDENVRAALAVPLARALGIPLEKRALAHDKNRVKTENRGRAGERPLPPARPAKRAFGKIFPKALDFCLD